MTKNKHPISPVPEGKKTKSPRKLPHIPAGSRPSVQKTSNGKENKGTSALSTIDIATGKQLVNVYFDPKGLVDGSIDVNNDPWLDYHLYDPANVLKDDNGILTIRMADGKVFKIPSENATYVHEQDNEGVDDILKLREFSEMSLIHTLRVRYTRDEIYTFVGTILISINPYKWFKDLYSDTLMHEYHQNASQHHAPHLFVLADNAYSSLMRSRVSHRASDQSIIISGESGAGKTEATKVIMKYLARVTVMDQTVTNQTTSNTNGSGNSNSSNGNVTGNTGITHNYNHHNSNNHSKQTKDIHMGELEEKVLSTNPLLEAFGNARTLRNDNSSRFGKFIKIEFSSNGRIVGATIEKYLLEKTRIIHQIDGERSYHIFYQLLRGAGTEMLIKLGLEENMELYSILVSSNSIIPKMDDAHEFSVTKDCMKSVGIDESLQFQLYSLIAGILHLCNVEFNIDDVEGQVGSVTESTLKYLNSAARTFGVEPEELLTSITKQNMYVGGSTIIKLQSQAQAIDKRNSFAKSIYMMIFNWLVDKINQNIAPPPGSSWGFIGVLDIYGFENFENKNSFEQLLINYANEKLQNHFNKHIFQLEQQEYENEGIDWAFVSFQDNTPCVELIDGRPGGKSGIFQTLDDCVSSGRNDININASFLAQLNCNVRHANYRAAKFNSDQRFGVLHYAGEVFYEIDNFVEKNRDSTNIDMKELMAKSSNSLLCAMVEDSMKSDVVSANGSLLMLARQPSCKKPSTLSSGSMGVVGGGGSSSGSGSTPAKVTPRASVNKLKEDSISKQFSISLKQLYDTLDKTDPHFVRCLKPNAFKSPDTLNIREISLQLKYAGMMEAIRIRQQGYALRELHEYFFNRYSVLRPTCKTLEELVHDLSVLLKVRKESWQVGTTKVFIRRELSDRLELLLSLKYSYMSRRVQRRWRYHRAYKAAKQIQAIFRSYKWRKRFKTIVRRIILIQKVIRTWKCVRKYHIYKQSILSIQRVIRGKLARMLTKRLSDNSYLRMTSDELLDVLRSTQIELKQSFQDQNFARCDELESIMREIKDIRYKLSLPTKKPTSRNHLELLIREYELAIKSGRFDKNMEAFTSIKSYLDHLLKTREKFPTAEEVRQMITKIKIDLDTAMNKKDFRKCAELQKRMSEHEELEKSLLNDKTIDPTMRTPLTTLKTKKEELDTKISQALQDRKFDLCSALQVDLEKITNELKSRDVTPEEASHLMEIKKQQLHDAMEIGDFSNVVILEDDIEELNKILSTTIRPITPVDMVIEISTPTITTMTIETYDHLSLSELTVLIKKTELELKEAEVNKDFKSCSLLEEKIAHMKENKASRPPKPTRNEVMEKIKAKESEIEQALTAKKYKECDNLNLQLVPLKALLDSMPTSTMLMNQIKSLEKELKELIAAKTYAKCEEIENNIAVLRIQYEEVLAEEKLIEPQIQAPIVKTSSKVLHPSDKNGNSPSRGGSMKSSTKNILAGKENSIPTTQPSVGKEINKPIKSVDRPVSKLRPKLPVTIHESCTVFDVSIKMAASRADAALLLSDKGSLAGIITDNDFTRRVISQSIDPTTAIVRDIMTKKPKCVKSEDSALEALEMMVDNRFRHLPVLDKDGAVVGLLDIAKCLYDAISVLEKVHGEESSETQNAAVIGEVMATAMKKVAGSKGSNKAQILAMTALMEQMFGGSIPTLRDITSQHEFESVLPKATVREASVLMAKVRKGVLVIDRKGQLQGILTPKDLLTRVTAKGLSPDEITVDSVMTPNPDCVSPDLTIMDALREMHDHKYLHLPVQEENGRIVGLVDVMELVISAAGEEGGKGWRTFFKGAMEARDENDISDTTSNHTGSVSKLSVSNSKIGDKVGLDTKNMESKLQYQRTVSKLRPKFPVTINDSSTLQEVAIKMAASRADAALLLSDKGSLAGIITDNDFTRRVISQSIDPTTAIVRDIMTKKPKCVKSEDSALEALEMMVDNRFRHLPVLDKDGAVVGLLDIAKCLYDAISVLEKVHGEESSETQNAAVIGEVMATAMKKVAGSKGSNKAQILAMTALMEQMFGGSIPTLRDITSQHEFESVLPKATVREASVLMAKVRKGVLVIDRKGQLQGILTPKDLLTRVTAKGLSPDEITVDSVMTPNPDCVSPDLTIMDALREMHDHKYLHLPVQEENGRIVGLVDVMELVISAAGEEGGKGWRTFFKGAMEARDENDISDTTSNHSASGSVSKVKNDKNTSPNLLSKRKNRPVSKLRPKAPLVLEESTLLQQLAETMARNRADAALLVSAEGRLSGIITDNDFTRRVVAVYLNTMDSHASSVMTKEPKCVKSEDSALEALEMMVDNRFRHLPVLDKDGAVVGLLDIAKCLYDAISVLEKVHGEESSETQNAAVIGEVMATAMKKVAGSKGSNKAQILAMKVLMEQMFGGSIPTLRDIISDHQMFVVRPSANVREAATLMAQARKGVLVMDEEELVGILTPKDVLSRVIATRKSPDLTAVSSVMTPNPDCVDANLTVIDALREMHDHKYLHLPVRDEYGQVLGLVDVMELVTHSAGGGSQDGKGWKMLLSDAMEVGGDNDMIGTSDDHESLYSLPSQLKSQSFNNNNNNKRRIRASYLDELPNQHNRDDSSDVFSVGADLKHITSTHSGYNASNFDSASVLFNTDFVYKVVDKDGNIHRIKSSSDSLDALKVAVGEKLQVTISATTEYDVIIKYIDDDKDEVIISSDNALRDAVEFARNSGLQTLKLSAYVVTNTNTVNTANTKNNATSSNSNSSDNNNASKGRHKASSMNKTVIYVGGGIGVIATIIAIGTFVLLRKK